MVEKGTEGRNLAFPGDMAIKPKGHVRLVKNSNLASPQGVATSGRNGGKSPQQHSEAKSEGPGSGRKSGTRPVSVQSQSPVLLLSPICRQDSPPKLKGIGGYVSSSPSSREGSPRTSPTLGCNYAGAKFSEPPSPDSLPAPPPHWTDCFYISSGGVIPLLAADKTDKYREITQQLKIILKVPA